MMKLSAFILLSEKEKKLTVLHEGILIAKRTSVDCLVFLLHLNTFYVEMYCNVENKQI